MPSPSYVSLPVQSYICLIFAQMVVGTSCVAVPMVLNGAIGAKLHIPFSVVVRSGFGYYFGYFCICSRAILAMFWLGIQGANGAQCITIMIAASKANILQRPPTP
jgi:cytosine/uracil/thiamine/allantoin permease